MQPKISIVIPVYNEECLLAGSVSSVANAFRGTELQILLIDDGSTDDTPRIMQELKSKYDFLTCKHFPKNIGYGNALRFGLNNAAAKVICYTDADLPVDPRAMCKIIEENIDKYDVIVANRDAHESVARSIKSKIYNTVINKIFKVNYKDVNFAFKVFKKEVLEKMQLSANSGFIDAEIMMNLPKQCKIKNVLMHAKPREKGVSKLNNVFSVLSTLKEIVGFWINSRQESSGYLTES